MKTRNVVLCLRMNFFELRLRSRRPKKSPPPFCVVPQKSCIPSARSRAGRKRPVEVPFCGGNFEDDVGLCVSRCHVALPFAQSVWYLRTDQNSFATHRKKLEAEVRRSFITTNNVPRHTTRARPVKFELAINGIQFCAIVNLDKTCLENWLSVEFA